MNLNGFEAVSLKVKVKSRPVFCRVPFICKRCCKIEKNLSAAVFIV